jgi:hypothetical protein
MSPGEKVLVPTEVEAGAFPGEKLVTVKTQQGTVSGFARNDVIIEQRGSQYLVAEVENVAAGDITVKLSGSFFTTTGLATVPADILLKAG